MAHTNTHFPISQWLLSNNFKKRMQRNALTDSIRAVKKRKRWAKCCTWFDFKQQLRMKDGPEEWKNEIEFKRASKIIVFWWSKMKTEQERENECVCVIHMQSRRISVFHLFSVLWSSSLVIHRCKYVIFILFYTLVAQVDLIRHSLMRHLQTIECTHTHTNANIHNIFRDESYFCSPRMNFHFYQNIIFSIFAIFFIVWLCAVASCCRRQIHSFFHIRCLCVYGYMIASIETYISVRCVVNSVYCTRQFSLRVE